MTLIIAKDEGTLAKEAAKLLLETAHPLAEAKETVTVALSGGKTPHHLFEVLAGDYYKSRIPWNALHFFWVDERCVPVTHADSNYGQAFRDCFSKVGIPPDHLHRIPGEMSSPREGAKAYENELKNFFKLDKSLPRFDLIFLGMGEDGHTASLFPRSEALKEKEQWVTANYVEKFSAHRITMTLPLINAAKRVVFLVQGGDKINILREIFTDSPNGSHYPAQMVKPENGELVWLIESKSAVKIPPDIRYKAAHV
jgi:6-phosphogluconolactonase